MCRRSRSLHTLAGLSALILGLAAIVAAPGPVLPARSGGVIDESEARRATVSPPPARDLRWHDHLTLVGADRWHASGIRGKGVKVAILDTGFRGWREHLGKALPAHVTARSFRSDGNLEYRASQHGILCGEVVHALAPEAELLFANWEPGRADQFLAAVDWARREGARILSVSVIMPSWSDGQGGGAMHQALSARLGAGDKQSDMLCFASAGNTTKRHWFGRFDKNSEGWHQWRPGQVDNVLRPWSDDEVAVELYGRAGSVYDLCVFDEATGRQVSHDVVTPLSDRLSAAVRFQPEVGHDYRLRVRHVSGPGGDFHVTTTFAYLDSTTPGANVCFPSDGNEVIALGAVDARRRRHSYSACGTNLPRAKPDLVAVVPFPSSWRPQPFGGTSAAAPQAAALAALCWSKHTDWTAGRIRKSLETATVELHKAAPDPETGYGLIHLPGE